MARPSAAVRRAPLGSTRDASAVDSGRRVVALRVLRRARDAVAYYQRQHEQLPLAQLASEFHVHIRTLQAAVRTGRLNAHFSVRSVFGRPKRLATRADTEQFMTTHYRRFSGQAICPAPLPTVPRDYSRRVRALRRQLRLTQSGPAGASAPRAKPSSISGSRGSERRRRSCGNACCSAVPGSFTILMIGK